MERECDLEHFQSKIVVDQLPATPTASTADTAASMDSDDGCLRKKEGGVSSEVEEDLMEDQESDLSLDEGGLGLYPYSSVLQLHLPLRWLLVGTLQH